MRPFVDIAITGNVRVSIDNPRSQMFPLGVNHQGAARRGQVLTDFGKLAVGDQEIGLFQNAGFIGAGLLGEHR